MRESNMKLWGISPTGTRTWSMLKGIRGFDYILLHYDVLFILYIIYDIILLLLIFCMSPLYSWSIVFVLSTRVEGYKLDQEFNKWYSTSTNLSSFTRGIHIAIGWGRKVLLVGKSRNTGNQIEVVEIRKYGQQ